MKTPARSFTAQFCPLDWFSARATCPPIDVRLPRGRHPRGGAPGVLTSKAMHANGTRIDRWYLVASDRIAGMGDVDGDGRAELILWDTYSLGLLRLPVGGSALTSLAQPTAGMFLGGWRLGSGDVIRGVAPMDGDGNADLLITSGWGWGVLRWNPSAAQLTSADLIPYVTLLPGGWRLERRTTTRSHHRRVFAVPARSGRLLDRDAVRRELRVRARYVRQRVSAPKPSDSKRRTRNV